AMTTPAPEQPAATPPTPPAGTDGKTPPPPPPAETPKRDTRIVVFGDSDFVSNNGLQAAPGNGDLFLNAVNWLGQQENLISIRPKSTEDRRVVLTQEQQFMVF